MAKKRLKIAFLSFYSGDVNRGVESFVDELATRLAEAHDVIVLQQGPPKSGANYKIERIELRMDWTRRDMTGTLARRFSVDYWSRKLFLFTARTFKRVLEERYDVVVPLNGGFQPLLMRIATLLSGGKLVGVGQSGVGWDERINLLCFPDAFVPLTTKARKWAKRFNPLVKLRQVPNGVDLDKFKPSGEKFKTELKRPVVITVGALVPGKRIDLVIKAVAKVKEASLLVVGDGDWRDELASLGDRLLGERYQQLQVEFELMPSIYRTGDLFALVPEGSEAFGIVYIEAMASGLPIVAIDDPQRREVIGKAGLFVKNPEDINELAKVIKNALDVGWGDKSRHQAKKFSWDIIARKYEELFLNLVGIQNGKKKN